MSEFDEATHVGADGACAIRDGWDINGNANGGYLIALAAQGMRAISGRPDPVTVTAHYLAPGRPSAARVTGEVVKSGRRFATVAGALVAEGRPTMQLLATFGDLAGSPVDGFVSVNGGPPDLPPRHECVRRTASSEVPMSLMDRVRISLHPDHARFPLGEPTGEAVMAGWFEFADGRPIDTLALLLAADSFPPAVFNLATPPGWVPTVELTVQVRARPAPGPLRCAFRTRYVHGGMFEEDGEIWDERDQLVALSRQLALLPR